MIKEQMGAYSFISAGSLSISFSRYFCIASASLFVTPSPTLQQSAFLSPFSVIWCSSVPFRPNLFGLASSCIIITASERSTAPSAFASPYKTSPLPTVVVVAEVVVVVLLLAVVVAEVVVVVEVSGFTVGVSPCAYS